MGKFVNNVNEFFDFCKQNEVLFVDFRFTDMIGTWHHITYNLHAISEETFEAEFHLMVVQFMDGNLLKNQI